MSIGLELEGSGAGVFPGTFPEEIHHKHRELKGGLKNNLFQKEPEEYVYGSDFLEGKAMENLQIKRGRIEIVGEDKVTILNLDGFCRDKLAITPGEAVDITEKIGLGEEVLYSVKGGRLIQVGVDRTVPELHDQYEALPRQIECVASA